MTNWFYFVPAQSKMKTSDAIISATTAIKEEKQSFSFVDAQTDAA